MNTSKVMKISISVMLLTSFVAAKDPYGLKREHKKQQVHNIIKKASKTNQDVYELLAIAITESSLNPKAYSRTKDSGLFQVNCKWWYKKFKYDSMKSCKEDMMNPSKNIDAAIHILTSYRKRYNHCKGNLGYRCYNGGPGWPRSKNIEKIKRYEAKVRERKQILHSHYKDMIESIKEIYEPRI